MALKRIYSFDRAGGPVVGRGILSSAARQDAVLAPIGIGNWQLAILCVIRRQALATPSEVGRALGMDRTTVIATSRHLIVGGAVENRTLGGGRGMGLILTEYGVELLAKGIDLWRTGTRRSPPAMTTRSADAPQTRQQPILSVKKLRKYVDINLWESPMFRPNDYRNRLQTPSRLSRIVAASALLVLAVPAFANDGGDPRLKAPMVETALAKATVAGKRSYTGIVMARVESNLGFRVDGKVIERLIDVGVAVSKGQPLMRIDDTDLGLALRSKQNAVIAAKASLSRTQADEQRFLRLLSNGATSHQVYDQAKQAYDTAAAQLDAATADENLARNELGYAVIYADSDGIVTDTMAEPGQVVSAGQPVIKLARSGDREASVNLPENVRPAIGSLGSATTYGGDNAPLSARLRQLSSAADPATRTFEARYVLDKASDVPLGSTIKVAIDLPGEAGTAAAVDVPVGAVYDNGRQTGVWVVADNATVAFEPVKILKIGEEDAVVTGLHAGIKIVAMGVNLLNEGMSVRLYSEGVASK